MSFFSSLERKLDELDHRSDAEWARKHPHIAVVLQSVGNKMDELDSRPDDEWTRKHPHSIGLVASVGRKLDQLDAPKSPGTNSRTVHVRAAPMPAPVNGTGRPRNGQFTLATKTVSSWPATKIVQSKPAAKAVQSKPVVLRTSHHSHGDHHCGHDPPDVGLDSSSDNNQQDASTFNNDSAGTNFSVQPDITQPSSTPFDSTNYQPDTSQYAPSPVPDDSTHQYYLDQQNASVDAAQQSLYDSNLQDVLASQDAWNQVQAADTYNSYQTDPSQYMSGGYSALDTSAIYNSPSSYDYSSSNSYNNY